MNVARAFAFIVALSSRVPLNYSAFGLLSYPRMWTFALEGFFLFLFAIALCLFLKLSTKYPHDEWMDMDKYTYYNLITFILRVSIVIAI